MNTQFSSNDIYLNDAVNECPCCHNKISPTYLTYTRQFSDNRFEKYFATCKCSSCYKVLFTEYGGKRYDVYLGITEFNIEFSNIYPVMPNNDKFSDYINKFSPQFVKIYVQSNLKSLNLVI